MVHVYVRTYVLQYVHMSHWYHGTIVRTCVPWYVHVYVPCISSRFEITWYTCTDSSSTMVLSIEYLVMLYWYVHVYVPGTMVHGTMVLVDPPNKWCTNGAS
jgi:hypothetical protein